MHHQHGHRHDQTDDEGGPHDDVQRDRPGFIGTHGEPFSIVRASDSDALRAEDAQTLQRVHRAAHLMREFGA